MQVPISDQKRALATDIPVRKRLLFVVTEDWFFVSHFLGLAQAAAKAGYEIGVVTRLGRHQAILEAQGFCVFGLSGNRGSLAIGGVLREMAAIRRAIAEFNPDILHLIAMRAIALGGLLALPNRRLHVVIAPTGLGFLFAYKSRLAKLARSLLKRVVESYAFFGRAHFVFENREDPVRFGLAADSPNVTLLGGAGVDAHLFPALIPPSGLPVRFAIMSRMLKSKGISAAIAAFEMARQENIAIELHLYGECDPGNPLSHMPDELHGWTHLPGVFCHGHVENVPEIWRDHHVAVLLSLREGMPRALAEAAACARPIIASDVTGCREIVLDGISGVLVPPDDVGAASVAMLRLANDPALRARMGEAGRAHFETRFTLETVSKTVLGVYARLGDEVSKRAKPVDEQKGEARG